MSDDADTTVTQPGWMDPKHLPMLEAAVTKRLSPRQSRGRPPLAKRVVVQFYDGIPEYEITFDTPECNVIYIMEGDGPDLPEAEGPVADAIREAVSRRHPDIPVLVSSEPFDPVNGWQRMKRRDAGAK